jgi:hypothetical protein
MSTLKELEKLLTQGKITRREFITRVSALGLMAAGCRPQTGRSL